MQYEVLQQCPLTNVILVFGCIHGGMHCANALCRCLCMYTSRNWRSIMTRTGRWQVSVDGSVRWTTTRMSWPTPSVITSAFTMTTLSSSPGTCTRNITICVCPSTVLFTTFIKRSLVTVFPLSSSFVASVKRDIYYHNVCLSVRPSVCLSHSWVTPKQFLMSNYVYTVR